MKNAEIPRKYEKMNKFTEQQINQILNIQGYYSLNPTTGVFKRQTIDVFKLTAALFIGNDKTKGDGENLTY